MEKAVLLATGYDFCRNPRLSLQIVPPLGILSLGSFLASRGVRVELIDVQVDFGFGITTEANRAIRGRVVRYLRKQRTNISWIGISLLSNGGFGIPLANGIHAAMPDVPIVLGGYFPTANHESLLRTHSSISAVVLGDGEAAAMQISRSLGRGESFLSNLTPNLVWLDPDGEIRRTSFEPTALEDAPILDMRLLRNSSCYPAMAFVGSRGCPYQCNFCLESLMRPYSVHPPYWIDRQLVHFQSLVPNDAPVMILDPIFGVNRRRTLEICDVLRARNFRYQIESRVDTMQPELLKALGSAGVDLVFLGLESASPDTLVRMHKVKSLPAAERYLKKAFDVLESCFECDITVALNVMVGFPGDREGDLQATLEFVADVRRLYKESGSRAGFFTDIQLTSIFNGSRLAKRLQAGDFPGVALEDSGFEGEKIAASSSPGVDLDLYSRYVERMVKLSEKSSPLFAQRLSCIAFSPAGFIASHPELTDSDGVTLLRP